MGDHAGDMRVARTAGALSAAVATGPCDVEDLWAAGADVVLPTPLLDLAELEHHAEWLRSTSST
ncbi:HAD family hydrolase [Streptomyces sp. Ncost-T10-10d]|uniref:HAD family hydrolase n=1 Tax=Streptomyces sp. Ncost-T10-10d TaxID=1839774 RepID=UPI00081D5E3A|nr:hypothetical protein GA0115254_126619 [Streptomyces sp. Ncost-T10-10d]